MAHPYRGAGRDGAKSKFRNILGHDKGAKHVNDDSVVNPKKPIKKGVEDVKILGRAAGGRLDRKSGGKVTVNIVTPQAQAPTPLPPPVPLPPPPGPMAGPPGPGAMPPKPPMGMPPAPGAGLPLNRASGGRASISQRAVKTQNKFQARINAMEPAGSKVMQEIAPKAINNDWEPKASGGYIGGEGNGNKLKQWAQYARKNSYTKKHGGGLTGGAGAGSGAGRLALSKKEKPKGR